MTTSKIQPHISVFSLPELDPAWRHLRDSKNSVLLRNLERERHHWRARLEATACPSLTLYQNHDSYKSLQLGTCTDLERFPSMAELASEPVDTVDERQGLPSEESQKTHIGPSRTFQFPSSDTSTCQKKNIVALHECDQNVPRQGEPATARR